MRTRKSSISPPPGEGQRRLRLSLGDAWPYFRQLGSLNLAVAARDTAKARQLEVQIKTLIAARIPAFPSIRHRPDKERALIGRPAHRPSLGLRTTRSAGSYLKMITAPGTKRGSRTVAVGQTVFRLHDAASFDDDLGGVQWTFIAPTVEHTPRTPRGDFLQPAS